MKLKRGDTLVVASHNPGKVREIVELLAPFRLHVIGARDLEIEEPEETEDTFAGNAALKARWVAEHSGHISLSDDSGLVVHALGGAPGIYSARWSGEGKDFNVAMARVERELKEKSATDLSAKFVSALALALPHETPRIFEGEVHGHLTFPPRGTHGFGYDPIFIADGMNQTFGEIDPTRHEPSRPRLRKACRERRLRFMSGFGIYVHWPFCAAKCPYCDFNSHVRKEVDEAGWIDAIVRELEWTAAEQDADRPIVETVFFGGGTPSLMQGASVARVLDTIARLWRTANDVEVTLESNPASADATRFADYRAAGVNRLSLGVQALNDKVLKMLGRLHNVTEAKAALALAMRNFERVSLDLIYARPDQTTAQWRDELGEALAFGTDHLSLYQLTIEPATPFFTLHKSGALKIPGEDRAAELFELTQEMTAAAGRPAYEISNHARPGSEARHNLLYWRYGAYAGVGPGAHGRLDLNGKRIATQTERLPERWRETVARNGHGLIEQSTVEPADAAREHLLMNLRLVEGLDLAAYRERWGMKPDAKRMQSLVDDGLLRRDGDRLIATPRGRLLLNSVIAALAD